MGMAMLTIFTLNLLVLLTSVTAQLPLPFEAPACAISCLTNYAATTPCNIKDIACLCSDTSPAATTLTYCVYGGACGPYDLVAFSEGLAVLCPGLFTSLFTLSRSTTVTV